MITSLFIFLVLVMQNDCTNIDNECLKLDVSITQKVENEGFHREIRWLIEILSPLRETWANSSCKLALKLEVSAGMYVYPDQVAELNRTGKLILHIDRNVDVEAAAHETTGHIVYVYLNNLDVDKIWVNLPIHLRYQRSQITGGYGKVQLKKPSLLIWCPVTPSKICGRGLKVEAPCSERAQKTCVWNNLTYQALFDDVELFVPVGDLDDYPLVSIVTLLMGCAGCIYILSILSTAPV